MPVLYMVCMYFVRYGVFHVFSSANVESLCLSTCAIPVVALVFTLGAHPWTEDQLIDPDAYMYPTKALVGQLVFKTRKVMRSLPLAWMLRCLLSAARTNTGVGAYMCCFRESRLGVRGIADTPPSCRTNDKHRQAKADLSVSIYKLESSSPAITKMFGQCISDSRFCWPWHVSFPQ